jgi:predicted RNA-binding Zn-ribbon protein involved in translation (DUF1610 family)
VQGAAGHPGQQGGGQEKNNRNKMESRGVGKAQGVADPPPQKKKHQQKTPTTFDIHSAPLRDSLDANSFMYFRSSPSDLFRNPFCRLLCMMRYKRPNLWIGAQSDGEVWICSKCGFVRNVDLFEMWICSKCGFVRNVDMFEMWICSKCGFVRNAPHEKVSKHRHE